MASKRQIKANKTNAKKSTGPKTNEGKEISKYNSLKHGLLAKEILIGVVDGQEDYKKVPTLISDLVKQNKPQGAVEEMLVEKIAVCYWRLVRCKRYESGVIRSELDRIEAKHNDEFEIRKQFNKRFDVVQSELKLGMRELKELREMHWRGKDLSEIYNRQALWKCLRNKVGANPTADDDLQPEGIRNALNLLDWTDDMIWREHIKICDEKVTDLLNELTKLDKDSREYMFPLQVKKKLASIPDEKDMGHLLKYETAINRELYKALNQLERMQRHRAGDNVPAPIKIDLDLDK